MKTATANAPRISDFTLHVNGQPLPMDTETQMVSITVEEDVNLPGMFALELIQLDDSRSTIPLLDDAQFAPGGAIEIQLGYVKQMQTVLKGEITALEPEFNISRSPGLIVRGYDHRHRLQRGRKTRTFVQQKDSDIATQLANDAGLSPQVTDSEVTHEYILQADQTDLAFLQERARRIQYEVLINDKTLIFQPSSNNASANLTLSLLDDLLEFSPRLSLMGQVSEVKARGWNLKDKTVLIGQATATAVAAMGGTQNGAAIAQSTFGDILDGVSQYPGMNQAELDQLAKACLNHTALTLITGEGSCLGHPDVRAGKVITINGIGTRFSGDYYVTAASHRYVNGSYTTHFTVQRNAS